MILRLLYWSGAAVLWLVALYGTLSVHRLPGDFGHAICGPWGCGPTVQSLVACHGFWLVLLAPLVGWVAIFGSGPVLRRSGWLAVGLSAAAVLSLVVWQAFTWLPLIADGQPTWFVRRCLFVLATTVELPVAQVLLAGLVWLSVAGSKRRLGRAGRPFREMAGEHGSSV